MMVKKKIINNNKAITLISLIITVIVLIVLSVVTISISIDTEGFFEKAKESKFKSDVLKIKEEYEIYKYNKMLNGIVFNEKELSSGENSIIYNGKREEGTIYDIIPSAKKYKGLFEIIKGTIYYRGDKAEQIKWAKEIELDINPFIIIDGELKSANDNLSLVEENGTVLIPPNVTKIARGAFNNTGIKVVVVPGTVKQIGEEVFANNSNLEKVVVEDGVQIIEAKAFQNCPNLKEVQIADSVTLIGNQLFYNCINLEIVNIPLGLKIIPAYAFAGCKKLKNINIPEGIEEIRESAFSNCKTVEKIHLPNSLKIIGDVAFAFTDSLKEITLTNNVNFDFENGILYSNNKTKIVTITAQYKDQTKITIPEKIIELKEGNFSNCSKVEYIHIPSTVETIKPGTFDGLIYLKKIDVDIKNDKYSSLNGSLYNKKQDTIITYLTDETQIILQEGIKKIEKYAFSSCIQLQKISLPKSLEVIMDFAFQKCINLTSLEIGENLKELGVLFNYNSGIKIIKIDDNNNYYTADETFIYNKDKTRIIRMICDKDSFIIPNKVKEIGNFAFHNSKMTSVVIPNTVEKIENSFNYCSNLTSIEIPSSVIVMYNNVFSDCTRLKQIKIHKLKNSIEGAPFGSPYGDRVIFWD